MRILYGDTAGSLTGNQKGFNQNLLGTNDQDNSLWGDAGMSITDNARGGNDTLRGGNSDGVGLTNTLVGDAQNLSGKTVGGNDALTGGSASSGGTVNNNLYGDASNEISGYAQGGNDNLTGGSNSGSAVINNTLYGDAATMSDKAVGGNDSVVGGNSVGSGTVNNVLYGDAHFMSNTTSGGNDILIAGTAAPGGHVWNTMYGDGMSMSGLAPSTSTVTLDFDSLPSMYVSPGVPVPVTAQLSTQYVNTYGVSFTSGSQYVAVVFHGVGHATSGTNAIAGSTPDGMQTFDKQDPIVATFYDPSHPTAPGITDFVSLRGDMAGSGELITLNAYDVNHQLIATDTAADLGGTTLSVSAPGIHSVEFLGTHNYDGVGLDDFTFHSVTPVGGPAAQGGADTFVFHDNGAMTVGTHNLIMDFSQIQHDKMQFLNVAGVHNFADLHFDTTTTPGSTIIHAGADAVTLVGFTGTLTAHDFLFV